MWLEVDEQITMYEAISQRKRDLFKRMIIILHVNADCGKKPYIIRNGFYVLRIIFLCFKRKTRMADIADDGRDRNEQRGWYPGRYSKYLHRNRQQNQSQDHTEEIRWKETGKLDDDTFPAHRRLKGYIFMKDVGIDDRQNIRHNRCRHIGYVSRWEVTFKEIIERDKDQITKDRIPNANKDKSYFLLMIQPKVMSNLFQRLLPASLIEIYPFFFDDQWPFQNLGMNSTDIFADDTDEK